MPDTEDHPLRQFGVLEADNVNRVQLVPMDGMEHRQRLLDDMPNAEAARKLFAHREFKQTYGYIVRRIESGTPAVQVLQGAMKAIGFVVGFTFADTDVAAFMIEANNIMADGIRAAQRRRGIMRPGQVAELPHHWDAP